MPNNKTLHKAIERHTNKIKNKRKALGYILTTEGKVKCLAKIKQIELKVLHIEQQLQYNFLMNRV